MSKKTLALIVVLLIITGSLLVIALSSDMPSVSYAPHYDGPTPTPFAQTKLNFSPNPVQMASDSGSTNIMIDTGSNPVTAVQLEIAYDPAALTAVSVTPGNFFNNPDVLTPLNAIDTKNGRVTYAMAIKPNETGIKGKGTVAIVSFTKNPTATATTTKIRILPKSLVSATGLTKSVLFTTNVDVTINFAKGTTTVAPSVAPTNAPAVTSPAFTPPGQAKKQ